MITLDEMELLLEHIACEMPEDFYRELNGGISLSPEIKIHPESDGTDNLFVLGEYYNDRKGYGGLGRYIVIYYGSFVKMYPHLQTEQQKEKLREILIHEFTHHLESLAGERTLEIKDAQEIERLKKNQ